MGGKDSLNDPITRGRDGGTFLSENEWEDLTGVDPGCGLESGLRVMSNGGGRSTVKIHRGE